MLQAANAFNDVTYGERPGTEPAYRMIADLDDHLRSRGAAARPLTRCPRDRRTTWTAVAMTDIATSVTPTAGQRWRSGRWIVLATVVLTVVAVIGT